MKKFISLFLSAAMLFACTACTANTPPASTQSSEQSGAVGEPAEAQKLDLSDVKIGVLIYEVSGEVPIAITAYLDGIKEATGLNYEMVHGSNYDEQTNISAAQNLISSGVDGIILCMDSGTVSILEECSMAGVYLAGFLCDFERSYDSIKDNEYFLGTICDGAYDNSIIGEVAADLAIKDGLNNVGIISFPYNYFPHKEEAVERFNEKISEYNATVEGSEQITTYDMHPLSFKPLEETYFSDHPEIDGIFSLAANYVYPTIVSTNRTDVKLYTTGYSLGDTDAFIQGNIGMMVQCSYESLVYPIALISNAVKGVSYADQPDYADRVDCTQLFFTTVEELETFQDKSFFFTADYSKAIISPAKLAELMPFYNGDATYADLVTAVNSCGFEDMK
jgi:ABC-type sugar transport system substrate-binding protein